MKNWSLGPILYYIIVFSVINKLVILLGYMNEILQEIFHYSCFVYYISILIIFKTLEQYINFITVGFEKPSGVIIMLHLKNVIFGFHKFTFLGLRLLY